MGLSFSELPVEVQLHVFAEAEPSALGKLAQVSKAFNRMIRGNELLYKQQYLQHWVRCLPDELSVPCCETTIASIPATAMITFKIRQALICSPPISFSVALTALY